MKDTITVGFYNVENLFDLWYDGNEYPEYRPGALGWNKQTWEVKVGNIASTIAAMRVDILGLCEVENKNALKGLQMELKKRGAAFPYSAIADAPFPTITAPCLLSVFPIGAVNRFGGGKNEQHAKRNILEADVEAGRGAIKVFVNHWPSKKHGESQRLAVARALEERIRKLPRDAEYVILGDLNSDYDELHRFHTEGLDDTKGVTGLNHVLKTVRGRGASYEYVSRAAIAAVDSFYHFDLWMDCPENRRASYYHRGRKGTLDHILLPHALFDVTGWSYLAGSFSVFTWGGKLLRNGEPLRWQMKGYGKRRFHAGEGYSDHLPIKALLVRGPFISSVSDRASSVAREPATPVREGGFEASAEGWVGCGRGIEVQRDSAVAVQGRFSLKIAGGAPIKNECAGRVIMERDPSNRGRSIGISFDLKGSGKLVLRIRAERGAWRYYNGHTFAQSGSPRYLPVRLDGWTRISVSFTLDNPAARGVELELRAGKGAPFCFYIDNVEMR